MTNFDLKKFITEGKLLKEDNGVNYKQKWQNILKKITDETGHDPTSNADREELYRWTDEDFIKQFGEENLSQARDEFKIEEDDKWEDIISFLEDGIKEVKRIRDEGENERQDLPSLIQGLADELNGWFY